MNEDRANRRLRGSMPGAPRAGLSLVEVAVSSMLTGTLLVISLSAVAAAMRTQSATGLTRDAQSLAQELLAEIVQRHFQEPGGGAGFGLEPPETSLSRANWDDVDDYHGWASSPPRDPSGASIPGFDGWSRSVRVAFADPSDPTADSLDDRGLKRIEVRVTDPAGRSWTMTAYRSRWGALEQFLARDGTIRTGVRSTLRLTDGPTTVSGINLLNHAEKY
jgi:hypothetical protein